MTHKGPFQPLPCWDSVISTMTAGAVGSSSSDPWLSPIGTLALARVDEPRDSHSSGSRKIIQFEKPQNADSSLSRGTVLQKYKKRFFPKPPYQT